MEADLASGHEGYQSAGKVFGEGQSQGVESGLDGFDRIGVWRVGHSESLSRELSDFTIVSEWPARYFVM
jgi:hypothetical protein